MTDTTSVTYNSQSSMYEINNYLTESEQDPYAKWLFKLPDRQAKARVIVRVDRMSTGNFGDVKPLGDGVWEARIDWGPGYRVYYAIAGKKIILLLLGGDKRKQHADVLTAKEYWADWQIRRKLK